MLSPFRCLRPAVAARSPLLSTISYHRLQSIDSLVRHNAGRLSSSSSFSTSTSSWDASKSSSTSSAATSDFSSRPQSSASSTSNQTMPEGWEDDANLNITTFSQLPHRYFGTNQHIKINEDFKEALRQILWQFRAPIRYAMAYGSGVFTQSATQSTASLAQSLSPHPHPPEAVTKWQEGGGKVIDFIFGVSHTEHWHSTNMRQHPEHYSFLRHLGSGTVSKVQDSFGAGVYFNPYITVNGVMIKYGVVHIDTICKDLSEWDTLYLAGRLHKPVKILRDDPRVRLANQINLMAATRTALLMLPEKFTEKELYQKIASISYMGDPRMNPRFGGENPRKVENIVNAQLPNFRQLYVPIVHNLPNVDFNDSRTPTQQGWENEAIMANSLSASGKAVPPEEIIGGPDGFTLQQDMDPKRRGNMVRRLPKSFRQKIYYNYQKKFQIPGSAFDKIIDEATDEDSMSIRRREGGEFEQRIGTQDDIQDAVGRCIQSTISWPSTSQSIKGIVTGGPTRAWKYLSEKRAKSKLGKVQKAAEKEEAKKREENKKEE